MAAKKPKAPKKFKQARKAAVADAKGAFSGKTKAVRRDPMAKVSAEDKAVLSEVKKEAKAGYITDDKGNKVFSKPTETAAERMARDRREAKAAVDRMYAKEDAAAKAAKPKPSVGGTAGTVSKPKPGLAAQIKKDVVKVKANKEAAKPKPGVKKPSVTKTAKTKPAAKKPTTATKSMTRAERSAANKAAWAKMTPAERKNWAATKGTTTTKPAATTPKVKTGVAAKGELKTAAQVDKYKAAVAAGKSKGEAVRIAQGGKSKALATIPKAKAGTALATTAASAAKKGGFKAAAGAAGRGAMKVIGGRVGLGITAASLAAGPLFDALNKGAKKGSMPGGNQNMTTGRGGRPQGFVEDKKVLPKRPEGSYPKGGGKGLQIGSGGTTTDYKVEHGDTLSGIAKKAGVTLSELLAANKKIKDPRKIYRNTTVKIPNNKPAPKPMYTGPVPYVPGSKAAKAYEASRK
jgi:hypothetical protein